MDYVKPQYIGLSNLQQSSINRGFEHMSLVASKEPLHPTIVHRMSIRVAY